MLGLLSAISANITESQNESMVKGGRDIWRACDPTPAQAGMLRAGFPDIQGRRHYSFSG